ncbi:MAG: hypothetical protein CSB48_00965 [Proteobacteria bacterium]|nr:MAG: hypothetical protein CSB48_00965 [Pseudomonadota bacterium]PIE40335.1 MAG: hypothetical protein CSA51_01215 [Gammaproteobacteria bacterium]
MIKVYQEKNMSLLKNIPLFLLVLIVYNVVAFTGEATVFEQSLFSISLVSGAVVTMTTDTVIVLFGLLVMAIEIFKSTRSSVASVIDHALSTLVFVAFLLEFVLVAQVGKPGFLILTVLSLLDVITGFTVTISAARRDVAVDR